MPQQASWRDTWHLSTLCWMVAGLLTSGWIALDEWAPGVVGRAVYAQSTVRWFRRWLFEPEDRRAEAVRGAAEAGAGGVAGQAAVRGAGYDGAVERVFQDMQSDGNIVVQSVEIRYIHADDMVERTLVDEQRWRYNEDKGHWLLESGFPAFQ